ncbi:hypothetical protein EXM58_00495 [Clostridium botulinum]|uniref:Uncharacterized protein n=1 Tax=Clostridium botulinum B2 450 TaxID=1379739 RepID=A0A0D1BTF6_CLOBO|nr:hypothetical protein [Clostridium botulinum]KIS22041.1 hypothetical protein N495_16255 [Clostridium botulinum B2 450]NEZ94438.1 hypothetical protein [Clostridium botulinum]NFA08809.1 hypothetical protein [Clostridium botulinum]NFA26987.1 hypothetical protein [Clostridium botulinum]HCL4466735.1 hypothetical protein [Clostridium botulinum]
MISRYELNELMGIPNHSPCDVCGKIDGGRMSGSHIGMHYRVCSDKCYRRLEMRINNQLVPFDKEEETVEQLMRIRIKQLKHQLKSAGIKPNKTIIK